MSTHTHIYIIIYMRVCVCERRTKLLITRNGHGQSGWSPIGCEGLYFHATSICKNRVSVSGWPPIGCECFRMFSHKIEHPMSTPHYFSLPLILSVTHVCVRVCVCVASQIFRIIWDFKDQNGSAFYNHLYITYKTSCEGQVMSCSVLSRCVLSCQLF